MPVLDLVEEALDAVDDLEPAAVAEREDEGEPVIVGRLLDRFVELFLAGFRQIRQAADRLEPDVFFDQLRRFLFQKTLEQIHEREDFGFRALPVLGRESVEGEELDPQIAAAFDAGADGVGAFFVAFDPGQAAFLGPAAVAIHDDRDVARDRFGRSGHD